MISRGSSFIVWIKVKIDPLHAWNSSFFLMVTKSFRKLHHARLIREEPDEALKVVILFDELDPEEVGVTKENGSICRLNPIY